MNFKKGNPGCECCDIETCMISEDLVGFNDESLGPHTGPKTLTFLGTIPSDNVAFDVTYNALVDGDSFSIKLGNAFTKISFIGGEYITETNNDHIEINLTPSGDGGGNETLSLWVVPSPNGAYGDEHCISSKTYIDVAPLPASIEIHSGTITFAPHAITGKAVQIFNINKTVGDVECNARLCDTICDIRSADDSRIVGVQCNVTGFPATAVGSETPIVFVGLPITYQETLTGLDAANGTHVFYLQGSDAANDESLCYLPYQFIGNVTSLREQWQMWEGEQTNYSSETVVKAAYLCPTQLGGGLIILSDVYPDPFKVIDDVFQNADFGADLSFYINAGITRIGNGPASASGCNNEVLTNPLDVLVAGVPPFVPAYANGVATAGNNAATDGCSLAVDFSGVEVTCSLLY